ncbi:N-acetyltryptophan 6-hydroxylase ivoC [Beauveria bassiana]|uniref:Cytochrome P450 CYP682N1 n=1 Tax=Beauveria bassiana (strain ARSEF 2860) TaxID=655819 RepID=J5K0S7_BEAB2|nr:Cytochrome P450 CYP682N1 [Beauveria bassiana ARSEF 2860]EJP67851.1 Cytochrome P450 CYP682N1 [Beauveria bassiana ARSEF 2860]KAH8714021.1 N-acetyltryptophan 6-hydroxylase ivoC [Beauveria bassiana]
MYSISVLLMAMGTALFIAHHVTGVIRVLFFSRISHIPGPKLAALTYFYQAYWDLWPHQGQFAFHCIKLHKIYGPIVRIGPDEVHIDDPSFYSSCYPGSIGRQRDKSMLHFGWAQGLEQYGDGNTFFTLSHDDHRMRRSMLAPFFSKQKVRDLEVKIQEKVIRFRERLLEYAADKEKGSAPIDFSNATGALTLDIISGYTLGKSIGALDRTDLARDYHEALRNSAKLGPIARAFPFIPRAMVMLPDWIVKLRPEMTAGKEFQELVTDLTRMAFENAKKSQGNEDRTILQTLINHPTAPEKEKEFNRLSAEVMIMFAAGGEPTGRALAVTLLHILLNPPIYKRVLSELRPLIPSYDAPLPPTKQLEALPYFSAVISEGLRMTHGVAGRLGRIAPNETLTYPKGKNGPVQIPAGVTFSQTLYLVHNNEKIFPEPFAFRPERYLRPENATEAETQAVNAAKASLAPFGKGARSCLGMNLAYSELYLTLAAILAGLKLELADGVSEKDGRITQEYLIGCLDDSRAGISINVLGTL